jgi:hypothetical protein
MFENRTHGIRSTYNAGCRCDECRAANAAWSAHLRARGWSVRHDLVGYRIYGCRCEVCTLANTEYQREYRARA